MQGKEAAEVTPTTSHDQRCCLQLKSPLAVYESAAEKTIVSLVEYTVWMRMQLPASIQ